MLTVHKQRIPFLLLLLPLQLVLVMLNVLVTEVISTSVLVPQLTTVVHPAANRETPKPTGREGINSPSHQWLYLIYLKDILKNRDFLVDTGASRSVFPHQSSAAPTGPGFLMLMADQIKRGSRILPLQFRYRSFQFSFLLAAVDIFWKQTSWLSLIS